MNGAKRLSLTAWRSSTGARRWVLLVTSLLAVLAIASLLPLSPSDSASRAPWQQTAVLRYRETKRLTQLLGLFEAFPALWYLVMVAGLLLYIAACTARRPPCLWPFLARLPTPGEFYGSHVSRQELPASSFQEGSEAAKLAFRVSPFRTV